MSMNELFGAANAITAVNARALPGTAELTAVATNAARDIVKAMEANIDDYRDRIKVSATDSRELDSIITELIGEYDANFLKNLEDTVIESILKSQQSKRSRAKGKQMTMENYLNLMTAAVAEHLLREATGKAKSANGIGRAAGVIDYTGAQLEAFAADQNALRKEIRNIQSKKSIMKSKLDFSETDERWLQLLKAEQQLKDLRVGGVSTQVIEVDKTKEALKDLFDGVDIDKLKSAEAHDMLHTIAGLLVEPTDEAEETEEVAEETVED